MNKNDIINITVLGFAIFSMLFGAGNVIFPPYLGFLSRESWLLAFICYFLADVGLAVIGLLAMNRVGSPDKVTNQIGHLFGTIMMATLMLCIGPLVAFPRTVATTFETSILPFFPEASKILFSILFVGLVFSLSIKQSKVVDIVGKYLTPLLLLGLLVLIVVGIFNPAVDKALPATINNVVENAIKTGYQTLDATAVIVFGAIIFQAIAANGYKDKQSIGKILIWSSVLAGILLFIVYGGLCYLGAYASTSFANDVSRAQLLTGILQNLMGKTGLVLFAIIVFLACITTAIALLSSTSKYFSELTMGRVSYKGFCIAISLFAILAANMGLDAIVLFASPILDLVYPPFLVLVFIALLCPNINSIAICGGATTAFLISIINLFNTYIHPVEFVNKLPMHSNGLDWVIPTLAVMIVCLFFKKSKPATEQE